MAKEKIAQMVSVRRKDVPTMVDIDSRYRGYYHEDFGYVPGEGWSEIDFVNRIKDKAVAYLCKEGRVIVGFVVYERHGTDMNIVRIGVLPDYEESGFEQFMINWLMDEKMEKGETLSAVFAEIDTKPIALFKSQGFKSTLKRGVFDGLDGIEFSRKVE